MLAGAVAAAIATLVALTAWRVPGRTHGGPASSGMKRGVFSGDAGGASRTLVSPFAAVSRRVL
jgi:hypothetical protein